ncbi:RNA-binding ATPase activator ESF2 [Aspergillus clavatus NRRL 1]|uniref:Pre-rRNA-processing protein esf2 n=1 Tax=Aspergillus clavatus (strain ATCC 1007 / CBS 513.65 / DSM 816 / NCTC 3887 / NRRL 1 / QM 1276 / 107) TaxID=344612 RepID=ESF2_ASPCL|nr:uncharacterized protein ACLA_075670 [Aspergillus clavatus NRRL 1]A1C807.1 RecName: Full=Pre-rRNA-processing protein esf2; AltName: Full=18S rRNA factor 2 [Aspergillus clavatus NRRL 1]EAW14528.1 conserved hypothetical protein [Aspergillus clavatus NRRL 1]
MTTRKRNEFLDIASEDEDGSDRGYDSEAAEESKGRFTKRRRTHTRADDLSDEESDLDVSDEDDERDSKAKIKTKSKRKTAKHGDEIATDDSSADEDDLQEDQYLDASAQPGSPSHTDSHTTTTTTTTSKPQKKKPLAKVKPPKKNKTGVVYLSSLPPYLKPFALKSMLETRGFEPITKVFLTPEVPSAAGPRRRSNKRKTYADGWVEFASKKTAKICAETLNASIVGGRKGGWYHDDVWNMKYLRGFKWADLMEQVQRERSEREARRRIEDTRARKEDKVFLEGVEHGKVLQGIQKKNEEKRRRQAEARADAEAAVAATAATSDAGNGPQGVKVRRLFKQNEVKVGRDKIKGDATLEDDTKRVLSKIF